MDVGGDQTWTYRWPSGERLAQALPGLADCRGRRVLDLGCGRGSCGRAALDQGAALAVFLDEAPTALAELKAELKAELERSFDQGVRARAACLNAHWGAVLAPGFELILGGDILYRPACHPALIATIAGALARDGIALLSDPRQRLEAELPSLAAQASLTWETERRSNWTLVRIRRRHGPPEQY